MRKIISIKEGRPESQPAASTTTHVCECGHECDSQDSLWRHIRNAALLGRNQCLPITTHGRPELQQQARTALTAHYTKKGLNGDELTQTVDKVMAVQFKPRPEYPSVSLEEMQKEIAGMERELTDKLFEMEPLSQSIN